MGERMGRQAGDPEFGEWATIFQNVADLAWQDQALCAQTDPDTFFPNVGESTREAKKVCMNCPVRRECLKYALENHERFGVWGGMSENERHRLKKRAV